MSVEVYETSASGIKLVKITEFPSTSETTFIQLFPEEKYRTRTGFGGSFTEAPAYLLNQLSKNNRD